MKIQKSNKKSFLKKIFIKICRLLNFEIIDQSNFTVPTLKKRLDENHSSAGRKSQALRHIEIDWQLSQQIISLFNSKSYMSIDVEDLPHTEATVT